MTETDFTLLWTGKRQKGDELNSKEIQKHCKTMQRLSKTAGKTRFMWDICEKKLEKTAFRE